MTSPPLRMQSGSVVWWGSCIWHGLPPRQEEEHWTESGHLGASPAHSMTPIHKAKADLLSSPPNPHSANFSHLGKCTTFYLGTQAKIPGTSLMLLFPLPLGSTSTIYPKSNHFFLLICSHCGPGHHSQSSRIGTSLLPIHFPTQVYFKHLSQIMAQIETSKPPTVAY